MRYKGMHSRLLSSYREHVPNQFSSSPVRVSHARKSLVSGSHVMHDTLVAQFLPIRPSDLGIFHKDTWVSQRSVILNFEIGSRSLTETFCGLYASEQGACSQGLQSAS